MGEKLSLSVLIGSLVGVALVIGIIFIAGPFVKQLTEGLNNDDVHFLEGSMDEISLIINNVNEGETEEMLFYTIDDPDIYLNVYNSDSGILECYHSPCAVLCFDPECESLVSEDMVRLFDSDVVFSKTGKVTKLNIGDGRFLLNAGKTEGKISFLID